jgi:muramoyltetrapeptide carboxypeptidase
MHSISPRPLTPTDEIVIVAPAGPVNDADIRQGAARIDFRVHISDGVPRRDGYFAGTPTEREEALNAALNRPGVGAILCARGGFGMTTIIDRIDMNALLANPTWMIGNSDITALLVHLWAHHRLCTIHGPMAARLASYPERDVADLHQILTLGHHPDPCSLSPILPGETSGPFIGGNLTMLAHMMGTLPADFADGCILFLEDVAEAPYRIERCLIQLKRNGVFNHIRGIVLGEFTRCAPGADGVTVEDVLHRNLAPLNVPIAGEYPAAHGERNRPFVHGHPVTLQVSATHAKLWEKESSDGANLTPGK